MSYLQTGQLPYHYHSSQMTAQHLLTAFQPAGLTGSLFILSQWRPARNILRYGYVLTSGNKTNDSSTGMSYLLNLIQHIPTVPTNALITTSCFEVLKKLKFSSLAWTHDNEGIFYAMFPDHESTEGSETEAVSHHKLYYHRLGTDQSQDILVAEFPEQPKYRIRVDISPCGR